MDSIRDRARGCLLGLAVGDALGGPLEFVSAERIVDLHGGPVRDMIGGGWLSLRPGQVTDDTDMARALARSLVERGGYEPEAALANYVRWFETRPPDIGITTREVLGRVAAGVDVADAAEQVHEQSGGRSAGNGSLMRIAPLAIRYRDDAYALMEVAERDSATDALRSARGRGVRAVLRADRGEAEGPRPARGASALGGADRDAQRAARRGGAPGERAGRLCADRVRRAGTLRRPSVRVL